MQQRVCYYSHVCDPNQCRSRSWFFCKNRCQMVNVRTYDVVIDLGVGVERKIRPNDEREIRGD